MIKKSKIYYALGEHLEVVFFDHTGPIGNNTFTDVGTSDCFLSNVTCIWFIHTTYDIFPSRG